MADWELPPITIHHRMSALPLGVDVVWSLADYRIPEAWQKSRGAGVRVGVIDTGVDGYHMSDGLLMGAVEKLRDFSRSRYGAADRQGHGTHVAGTIAGRNRVGVAPEASLLVAKGLGDGGAGTDQGIVSAIEWCCAEGADIINMSLGSFAPSPLIMGALDDAIRNGVIPVCAAGNDGGRPNFPARWKNNLAVSAVDRQRRIASFSCRGPEIDIAAPGTNITSAYLDGAFAELSGTSMATPFVSGVLALRMSHDKAIGRARLSSLDDVRGFLAAMADDAGEPGRDSLFGVGLPSVDRLFSVPGDAVEGESGRLLFSIGPLHVWGPGRAGDLASVSMEV